MKVLVTGATGLVGRALVRACLAQGWVVHAAVRSMASGQALLAGQGGGASPQLRVLPVGDMSAKADWSAALAGVEVVFHLAARVHQVYDTDTDPLQAYRLVNTDASILLAQEACRKGVNRFLFVSSVKVLGEATAPGRPFDAHSLAYPVDAYAVSKWEAEQALHALGAVTGMGVTVLRPPLVYGPGVKANFASLWHAVGRGWPLPLGSITANRRSLVGVDNLVSALLACATHPAAVGQRYLVSDDDDMSTAGLVRAMAAAQGVSAHLWLVPVSLLRGLGGLIGRGAAVDRLCGDLQVDVSAIKQDLGWRPVQGLQQGLNQLARAGGAV